MKREPPSDHEIEQLIAPAFERLPAPDARRLGAIERQLLEQPGRRGGSNIVWWWLAGALFAGAASALWWAADYNPEDGSVAPEPGITEPEAPSPAQQPAQADSATPEPGNTPPKPGPRIYQRERF